ncbi:hypothetical protein GCM10007415_47480 [Parapedobacter pyrenivorans]|uniref:DUF4961 domain-containing protein n=1 Tax=Parapedobacter pyrenivorans TaxID=1305674 RepID=A0A917MF28_9SPHI|nr:DUF4961 domain-containing protein [Parapedobacter pyrenivorans]GGH05588.1 hypothetical protein GCM10007415_47480 [Parapedobacter pyrenivorans]
MKRATHTLLYGYLLVGLFVTMFLVHCGLTALTVTVPEKATVNERVTFVMHSGAEPRIEEPGTYTTQLLAGIMVPKSWNARTNAVLTFTSPKGNGVLRMIPDSEIEPVSGVSWHQAAKNMFGIGPNLVDDFEWIVYRSTQSYTFRNNEDIDFDVNVECNVGSENMLVKLGFYVGSSIENLRPEDTDYKKVAFSQSFEVTGGEGDLIDFVNPQLATVQPVRSLDNDIITLMFDAGVTQTALENEDDIYLTIQGFDEAGLLVAEVNEQTGKTRLTSIGGKRFLIDFWPRGYFSLESVQRIARLEYFVTDASGIRRVGYGNTDEPFTYTFRCQ